MEPEKYFIIYLNEFYGDGMSEDNTWKIGSKLFDTFDEAKAVYNKVSDHHSCKICKTIYG